MLESVCLFFFSFSISFLTVNYEALLGGTLTPVPSSIIGYEVLNAEGVYLYFEYYVHRPV